MVYLAAEISRHYSHETTDMPPIRKFSDKGQSRARIAFLNGIPPEISGSNHFTERKFECVPWQEADLDNIEFIAQLSAVIISQQSDKRNALGNIFESLVPRLLDYDVRVYVRIARDLDGTATARRLVVDSLIALGLPVVNLQQEEQARFPVTLKEREGSFPAPYVYIFDSGVEWPEVANVVCGHPAESELNTGLDPDGCNLEKLYPESYSEWLVLLQRAFWDCSTLHLTTMPDGLSGAPVFRAYASLSAGLAGDWPYLHFVKLGPRTKITDEYDKYVGRALDYVPFNLGPRLRFDRCNLGARQGILVGDFVEGAELMRDAARDGRAGQAISNLFNKTLGSWRKQAKLNENQQLSDQLDRKWHDDDNREKLIELPESRAIIVQKLGVDPNVSRLREIFNEHGAAPSLCAPAHGDLHATNVLVRNGDAIVIDFERMEDEFPLLYDPASLEGGLLVEGFCGDERVKDDPPSALLSSIAQLYDLNVLNGNVKHCQAVEPSCWFYECVDQIRMIARHGEFEPGQYALVLATCLIRKGCNPHNFDSSNARENLRAIAFVLGQRILMQIAGETA